MPGELQRRAAEFRRELLQLERGAASDMVRAYGASWQRVEQRVTALWQEVTALREAGEAVPPVRLMQLDRYLRLQDEITGELRRFAQYADQSVAATQLAAVDMAQQHSPRLISAVATDADLAGLEQFADFAHAPRGAIEALVGYARGNTPLGRLLDAIPGQVNGSVRDTLIAGLALGQNPRETARQVRRAFGTGLARALTISRTETLRAYRQATLLDYQANDDLLEGWIWSCALDRRSCPVCWAMHGRVFKLRQQPPMHPQCRCSMIPMLKKAYRGDYEPTRGPVLFQQASPEVQRAVLGPGAFEAYQNGQVGIEDFVTWRRSREWGVTVQRASLGTALNRAQNTNSLRLLSQAPPVAPDGSANVRRQILESTTTQRGEIKSLSGAVGQLKAEITTLTNEMYALNTKSFFGTLTADQAERYKVLPGILETQRQRMAEMQKQFVAAQRSATETARTYLQVQNPADVKWQIGKNAKLPATWKDGLKGFNELIDARLIRENSVEIKAKAGRAYYSLDKVVRVSKNVDERTVVHELGHWLEHTNPDVHEKILEFYDRRTQGEKLEWLGEGYGKDEKTRRDKFIRPYMGKEYMRNGVRDGTEILSMGLEYFYAEPVKLAEEDPDYFDFIFNLVRGNG